MRKKLIGYIAILIAIVVLIFLARQFNWLPSLSDIFKAKPVIIENTPILIKEINELSQLATVASFDEVVADSFRISHNDISNVMPLPILPPSITNSVDRIVLVGRGRVIAGIDLKKITANDIRIKADSISIRLPPPEILDAILNPSDFDTFTEEGDWTPEAVTLVKIKARDKMVQRALGQGILNRAGAKGRQLMENFLTGIGFRKIHIE
jgi:hypothetical protein